MDTFLKLLRRPAYADTLLGLCAFPFMLVFNNLLYIVLGERCYLVTSYCKPETEGAVLTGTNLLFIKVLVVKLILIGGLFYLNKKKTRITSWLPKLLFSVAMVEGISVVAYFYDLVFQTRTIAYFGASVYLYPVYVPDLQRGIYAITIALALLTLHHRLFLSATPFTEPRKRYLFLGSVLSTVFFIGALEVYLEIIR